MIAYLDLAGGLSGDIFLACFLDAGVEAARLEETLQALPLADWSLEVEETKVFSLAARRISFKTTPAHEERTYFSIRDKIIGPADLPPAVKERSLAALKALAEAEARVHGQPIEKVHFHEVGADDSILDLVGAAACLDLAGVTELRASPVPLSRGMGDCRHGPMPLPAPATAELLRGKPVVGGSSGEELITPTGAAILSWAEGFGELPLMTLAAIGSGVGQRVPSRGLTRLFLGRSRSGEAIGQRESVSVLRTTIDDMSPEIFGPLMDRLLAAGAFDVVFIPVQMKKNRPGVRLEVLASPDRVGELATMILEETTTLGLRLATESRLCLERRPGRVEVDGAKVGGKWIRRPSGRLEFQPEYADCQALAGATGRPLRLIYELALRAAAKDEGA